MHTVFLLLFSLESSITVRKNRRSNKKCKIQFHVDYGDKTIDSCNGDVK